MNYKCFIAKVNTKTDANEARRGGTHQTSAFFFKLSKKLCLLPKILKFIVYPIVAMLHRSCSNAGIFLIFFLYRRFMDFFIFVFFLYSCSIFLFLASEILFPYFVWYHHLNNDMYFSELGNS